MILKHIRDYPLLVGEREKHPKVVTPLCTKYSCVCSQKVILVRMYQQTQLMQIAVDRGFDGAWAFN